MTIFSLLEFLDNLSTRLMPFDVCTQVLIFHLPQVQLRYYLLIVFTICYPILPRNTFKLKGKDSNDEWGY